MWGKSKKVLTYYRYGKPGYIRQNCMSNSIIPRPQINIIKKIPIGNKGTFEKIIYDNQELSDKLSIKNKTFDRNFEKYINKAEGKIIKFKYYWKNCSGNKVKIFEKNSSSY